ncbi:hypothetical protein ACF3NG_01860 [Aerococcaceae bacterium WGS1372]
MATIRRMVETKFWTEPEAIERYSAEDKYFMLYLMTNPASTQLGIYRLSKRLMSFESGYELAKIDELLERFQHEYGFLIYSEKTQEIAIKHSLTYTIVKGGKPVSDLLLRELSQVKNSQLILEIYQTMYDFWDKSERAFDKTIQKLFEHELFKRDVKLPLPRNEKDNDIDNEIENDNDVIMTNVNEINNKIDIYKENEEDNANEKEKDNDNENEESYLESYGESSNDSSFSQYAFDQVADYYTSAYGELTATEIEIIKSLVERHAPAQIKLAFDICAHTDEPILSSQAYLDHVHYRMVS